VLCQAEALTQYWKNVTAVVASLNEKLTAQGAKILLCGGDSILAEFDSPLSPKLIYDLFLGTAPVSFSAGTGETMLEAYIALKTAKASGKRCWIEYRDLSSIFRLQYDLPGKGNNV
jgi:hypothetical protein